MAEAKKKDRGQWFREMKSELKKVVWPNRQTVTKNTGACIWVFDFAAVSLVQMILSFFGG